MDKNLGKLFCVLSLIGLCCCAFCSDVVYAGVLSEKSKAALDEALDSMVGDQGIKVPGLGVVVYKDGEKVYSRFAGRRYIDPNDPSRDLPVTGDTRFRIASVSKQFTALTIMQLVESGSLKLDDDVSQYLGFELRNPNYPDVPITVRMLLSHTSSLRDGDVYSIPPQYGVIEFFQPEGKFYEDGAHFAPLGQAPGENFKYSNLNYGILGTIVESVTGQRFDEYQRAHILKDLDISGSYNPGDFSRADMEKLGVIYQKQRDGVWDEKGPWIPQIDDYEGKIPDRDKVYVNNPDVRETDSWYSLKGYKPGTNATFFSPQGGLRISFEELEHLLQMLMNRGVYEGKQVVRPDLIDEMFKIHWRYDPANPNGTTYGGSLEAYGLGEYLLVGNGTSRGVKDHEVDLQGHLGEAYGLLSGVLMRPGTRDGFIYIMNGEAVAEDDDPRSGGVFSGNYVWEENMINAICVNAFVEE